MIFKNTLSETSQTMMKSFSLLRIFKPSPTENSSPRTWWSSIITPSLSTEEETRRKPTKWSAKLWRRKKISFQTSSACVAGSVKINLSSLNTQTGIFSCRLDKFRDFETKNTFLFNAGYQLVSQGLWSAARSVCRGQSCHSTRCFW